MISKLHEQLQLSLKDATELNIAVALMNDFGLKAIEGTIDPTKCKRKYLLGIHLPTAPSVLSHLLNLSEETNMVEVKIYKSSQNYHPKVYLIRNSEGQVGYLGSANATKGGLINNVEMNSSVTGDNCNPLFGWFDTLFESATKLDKAFIKRYELIYNRNKKLQRIKRSNLQSLDSQFEHDPGSLDLISTDHFFAKSYYMALRPEVHEISADKDFTVDEERKKVIDKLLELGEIIYPWFTESGMHTLERAKTVGSRTSRHSITGRKKYIDALWLHFGKSEEELESYRINQDDKFKKLTNHVRLQVILRYIEHNVYFGIWLYIGKANGSSFDRDYFISSLDDPYFLKTLKQCFRDLGGAYRISIGHESLNINDIIDEQHLKTFLLGDDKTDHYKIERNYSPADSELTNKKIKKTVLTEFSSLYKLYELYKHRYLFIGKPSDFTPDQLNTIKLLIESGGQVTAKDLLSKIRDCEYLGFFFLGGEMVSTAAIKRKKSNSVLNTTLKAGLTYTERQVPLFELGYCFTKPDARRKGINKLIISALLKRMTGKLIYAITADAGMKYILAQKKFVKKGNPFKGSINPVLEYWEAI